MAKTRKLTFTCPATVEDRKVKTGAVKFTINPGPDGFLLKSKARKKPVSLQLIPGGALLIVVPSTESVA